MEDPYSRPVIVPSVAYRDPRRALAWLEHAFGFERVMVISDKDGNLGHAEMRFRGGPLYVGPERAPDFASPQSLGGKNTQSIHIQLKDGVDAHCARARAEGAEVVREPADQFYGDRVY
jgi:uncharacterized glyoxalase superfamily protein PhnB